MFSALAARYKNNPGVIGFEPINEPMPGLKGSLSYGSWNEKRLYVLYEKVGRAVHSVDERFLIFADSCALENLGSWSEKRRRPEVGNLVFAPHYYDVGYFKIELTTGRDRALMKNGLTRRLALGRQWEVPILVGEFGIEMEREDAPEYIHDLYSVFDEMKLSGTIWEASMSDALWNGRVKNVMYADGSIRPNAMAVNRPYPRAVTGMIREFGYDPGDKSFHLEYKEDPKAEVATEIYLPRAVYGNDPLVSVSGAEDGHDFNPAKRTLTVYRAKRAGVINIRVTPSKP